MIDTLGIHLGWQLRDDIASCLANENPPAFTCLAWQIKHDTKFDWQGNAHKALVGIHKESALRIFGRGSKVERAEVSLPRLLYGANGILIVTPLELKRAIDRVFEVLREVASPIDPKNGGILDIFRVDLVLNLAGTPKNYIIAHRHLRHPLIKEESESFGSHGLRFRGTNIVIQFYDKRKQVAAHQTKTFRTVKCTRVEIQIKSKLVRELFGDKSERDFVREHYSSIRNFVAANPGKLSSVWDEFEPDIPNIPPVTHIDFYTAYRCMRSILLRFESDIARQMPPKITLDFLLAVTQARGQQFRPGVDYRQLWELDKQPETIRKRRKRIDQFSASLVGHSWKDILPLLYPPYDLLFNVDAAGKETPINF